MAQDNEALIPGLIGNFNIPKAVIENKVDVLTFLELMVRKGVVTAAELDDIRAAVVAHLNAAYPELDLSYTTPASSGQQSPMPAPAAQQTMANSIAANSMMAPFNEKTTATKPTDPANASAGAPGKDAAASFKPSPGTNAPEVKSVPPSANKPLWVQAPPPKFIK